MTTFFFAVMVLHLCLRFDCGETEAVDGRMMMKNMTLSCCCCCLLLATFCLSSSFLLVAGFVTQSTSSPPQIVRRTNNLSQLQSSPLFQPEKNDDDNPDNEFKGFNPFTPGAKIPTKGGFGILSDSERKQAPSSTPGGQISPRQMKMKEITTELLLCISDDESVSELLLSHEEFLLEQLNNLDAVLEPDSVLSPDMSRSERFRRYEEVMQERIDGARAPAAKKALGALKDFVLSRE